MDLSKRYFKSKNAGRIELMVQYFLYNRKTWQCHYFTIKRMDVYISRRELPSIHSHSTSNATGIQQPLRALSGYHAFNLSSLPRHIDRCCSLICYYKYR